MVTSLFPSTHSVAAYAQNNEVAATSEETDVSSTSEYEPESSDSKTDPEDVDSQSLTSSTSDVSSTSAPVSSSQEDETTAAEPDAIGLQAVAAEELTDSRAQTSTSANLGDFLTGVTINAPTDANGNYIINPGNAYDMTEGYAVKNTNTATTLVEIRKQWIGKPLDAVTVKLLADGVEMMEISLKAEFEWTHTVTDLPKYDATDGHEIAYTVAEDPVEGYDAQVVGDMQKIEYPHLVINLGPEVF